jgi:hypothetical protein
MPELKPLCDFPAGITKVQTMADGSPRIILDLPESEVRLMTRFAELQVGERYLYIVIYDADEFAEAIENNR